MPTHVIDYFATLGRKDGHLEIKQSHEGQHLNPTESWFDAITDLAVVMEGEEISREQWEICDKTSAGLDLFPPHIAFKRRKDSRRLDHIVEIRLVQEGAIIPKGFELIRLSCTEKYSAYLNPIGFLAVKRGVNTNIQYIHGDSSIHKIEVVLYSEGEELPDNYEEVVTEYPISHTNHSEEKVVVIAVKTSKPIGFCDFTYEYDTIDRYPVVDQKDSILPVNELPMFGFPQGLRLHYGSNQQYPLPVFFTFVFTDYKGDHFYAECLRFYEQIENSDIVKLFNQVYDVNIQNVDDMDLFDHNGLFCPKVICLISRKPFYRAMRRLLRQIYSLSLSSIPCPIEFFLSSVINQIPLPVEGGRPFHIILDAALISSSSRSLAPIIFQQPTPIFFPLMDFDFSAPFKCLSIENVMVVFTLMLREAKIVFISQSNILLTETMETFRSLLFPLVWSSCFVTPLPDALSGMLDAPGGFMIGFHITDDPADDTSLINTQLGKGISLLFQQSWSDSLCPGTYIIDLSSNTVYQHNGKKEEPISSNSINELLRSVPTGPKRRLLSKLSSIATKCNIKPNKYTYVYDSAFDFQPIDKNTQSFPTLEIRDSFLAFMIDILYSSTQYIKPPSIDLLSNNFRTFKENFLLDKYIESIDHNFKDLYILLCETQMFAMFLQQRSEGKDLSLLFYENASNLLNILNLSANGYNNISPPPLPVPLYQLLHADELINRTINMIASSNNYVEKGSSPNRSISPKKDNKQYLNNLVNFVNKQIDNNVDNDIDIDNDLENETLANEINDSRRYELDKYDDLDLYDVSKGPLVIPGPNLNNIKKLISKINDIPNNYRTTEGRYIYRNGWPKLDKDLLKLGLESIHDRIQDIRNDRTYTLECINENISKYIRSFNERKIFGKMNKVNFVKDDLSFAVSGLLDISSVCISMLTTRIICIIKPSNDILQILGILGQLNNNNFLNLIDPCIYRGILVSTTVYDLNNEVISSELMKRISCLIYDIISENSSLDVISYGLYIQSLSKKPNKNELLPYKISIDNSYIDTFTYLEELGYEWFKYKNQKILTSLKLSQSPMIEKKQSNLRRISINRLRSRTSSEEKSIKSSNSFKDVTNTFGFNRMNGLLTFYNVEIKYHNITPINLSDYSTENFENTTVENSIINEFADDIMQDINNRYKLIFQDIQSTSMDIWIKFADHQINKSNVIDISITPEPTNTPNKSPVPPTSGKKRLSFSNMLTNKVLTAMDTSGVSMNNFIASNINLLNNVQVPIQSNTQTPNTSPFTTQQNSPAPITSRLGKFLSPFMSSSTNSEKSSPVPVAATVHSNNTSSSNVSTNVSSAHEVINNSQSLNGNTTTSNTENGTMKIKRRSTRRRNTVRTLAMRESFSDEEGSEYEEDELPDDIESLDSLNEHEIVDVLEHKSSNNESFNSNKETLTIDPLNMLSELSLENSSSDKTSANQSRNILEEIEKKQSFSSNLIGVQDKISKIINNCTSQHREIIGINCQNICSQCQYSLLDSEIMALWYYMNNSLNRRNSYVNKKKNIVLIHRVNCPYCQVELSPVLHIKVYKIENNEIKEELHNVDIPYISPFGLRCLMEDTIEIIGEKIININLLYSYNPILYWNICFYMNRMNLPTGFISSLNISDIDMKMFKITSIDHNFNLLCPIVIGYQEHIVKSKILSLIDKDYLIRIYDFFPLLTENNIEIIENISKLMDGSIAGMREAIIIITKLLRSKLLIDFNIRCLNRYIYLCLYTIAIYYNNTKLIKPISSDIPDGLTKGIPFDNVYTDAINCALSPSDFEFLGCSRYDLLGVIPNDLMKTFHISFGFLL